MSNGMVTTMEFDKYTKKVIDIVNDTIKAVSDAHSKITDGKGRLSYTCENNPHFEFTPDPRSGKFKKEMRLMEYGCTFSVKEDDKEYPLSQYTITIIKGREEDDEEDIIRLITDIVATPDKPRVFVDSVLEARGLSRGTAKTYDRILAEDDTVHGMLGLNSSYREYANSITVDKGDEIRGTKGKEDILKVRGDDDGIYTYIYIDDREKSLDEMKMNRLLLPRIVAATATPRLYDYLTHGKTPEGIDKKEASEILNLGDSFLEKKEKERKLAIEYKEMTDKVQDLIRSVFQGIDKEMERSLIKEYLVEGGG